MMYQKKSACALLALLTVSSVFLSCGSTEPSGTETGGQASAADSSAATETEAPTPFEQLPEADFGGYEFHCLLSNQDGRQIDLMTEGEETGDILNDLVYKRNRLAEEKYNVRISGRDSEHTMIGGEIRKQVQGGLQEIDLYFYNCGAAVTAQEGLLYNLNDLPGLSLENPWWDAAALRGMSVGGRNYIATGDISPTGLITGACMTFNKNLFAAHQMEEPYGMVRDGKWTLDAFDQMTRGLTEDLNGDGEYTFGDDLFGFSSWCFGSSYSLFYGAGGTLSGKDANDIPTLDWDMEHIADIYDKMYQIIHRNQSYFVTDIGVYPTAYECFTTGKAYFCELELIKIDLFLRDMKDDYGILPIPKWDENQENYLSCVNGAGCFIAVPMNAENPERTGTLTEALAAGAYSEITPSLYEVITKTRNVRDEESAEMVNIIIRNRVFDPVYVNAMPGFDVMQRGLEGKKEEVVSRLEKIQKSISRRMEKLIAAYTDI